MPQEQHPGQQALVTLKYEPQLLNLQQFQFTTSGGVVSYDTGTENVLALVSYENDVEHYNRIGHVIDVEAAPGPWGPRSRRGR